MAPASIAFLSACGDSVENTTINQMGMDVVEKVGDLPKCASENEGEMAFVKGETSARICVDGEWYATVAGDGPDFSCKTEELKDKSGLKIVCNGDSIGVVLNGAEGKQGEAGEAGEKGDNGGCTFNKNGSTLTIDCGNKAMKFEIADDGSLVGGEEIVLDSEMVAVSLDSLVGYTQKGPFIRGATVYLYELDNGRTLKQTSGNFTSNITRDDGYYKFSARDLVSQYAMVVVDGYYRNEVTGEPSDAELRLKALTDMRKHSNVNVNLLSHLEYDRVYYLVTHEKMTVKKAKQQAQKEILSQFHIELDGNTDAEAMDVFGTSDADAALLAVSVMLQGDRPVAKFSELLTKISSDIEKDSTWKDAATKKEIAQWCAAADSSGRLDTIRNNVKGWGLSLMVPKFEKHVRHFWNTEFGLGDCTAKRTGDVMEAAKGMAGAKTRYICKDMAGEADATNDYRWVIASDIEKDSYKWTKDTTDGVRKTGDVTGKIYVFDKTGSFNGIKGWRLAESIEQQYGGCREALYDSIRTDTVKAYYYTCSKEKHKWVQSFDYLLIDTQYWPDSTDGKVRWGDSVGVVDTLERICYVWDEAPQYNGWRTGNMNDCTLGLLGCTAKRGSEMRKTSNGCFYSCANNSWTEITDTVYINTFPYRCTPKEEGDNVFKEGDLVYGIEYTNSLFACDNGKWRKATTSEEQIGMACTANSQGNMTSDSTRTCDAGNWRPSIVYDFPVGKDWTNPELTYDTLVDSLRDGRVYKTVKINGITVMAENLNYADSVNSPYIKGQIQCYKNDSTNCLKGGRYYSWTAAMNIDPKWLNDTPYGVVGLIKTPHQGICPNGWHIPTDEEWRKLFANKTYEKIQAKGFIGWSDASNETGFSALPVAGQEPPYAYFWSAFDGYEISHETNTAYFWRLDPHGAGLNRAGKGGKFAVRCFKD